MDCCQNLTSYMHEQVLVHWACQKITACLQQPDDQLRDSLTGKLKKYRGIRYSLIAGHAETVGRKGLATMLLEYETRAADQVGFYQRSFMTALRIVDCKASTIKLSKHVLSLNVVHLGVNVFKL